MDIWNEEIHNTKRNKEKKNSSSNKKKRKKSNSNTTVKKKENVRYKKLKQNSIFLKIIIK